MGKKKTNTKSKSRSSEITSLPTFSYGYLDGKYYMFIEGNRMKVLLDKRQIPANQPVYNFLTDPSFGEESTINMSVGESSEGSWSGGYVDVPGTTNLPMLDHFFETSDENVATIDDGEESGEYVIHAVGVGTAIIKVTEIDPGNIRRSASVTVVVTAPVLSFDANGGSGTMDPIEADSEGKVTLPQSTFTAPEADQYAEGWDIGSDHYNAGEEITITENTVAQVHWATQK